VAPDPGVPDPGVEIEVRAWLDVAMLDLQAAIRLVEDPDFARVVVYHCQQAAEKGTKGLLTWHGIRFGRTHDLDMLGSLARPLEPVLGPVLDRAVELTPYAWLYRYPPDSPPPLEGEAGEAIVVARELLDAIVGSLPGVLGPR
jgi:HEPN domain-containing protein